MNYIITMGLLAGAALGHCSNIQLIEARSHVALVMRRLRRVCAAIGSEFRAPILTLYSQSHQTVECDLFRVVQLSPTLPRFVFWLTFAIMTQIFLVAYE